MKIYAISDLHLSGNNPKPMDIFGKSWENYIEIIGNDLKNKTTKDDVVLIAGDISWAMTLEDAIEDLVLISQLCEAKKVIIRGNHDYWWKSISNIRSSLPQNMYAIQNDCLRLGSLLICGTRGWTVPEPNTTQSEQDKKIYQREIIRLNLTLDAMEKQRTPKDKVVLMIHYPPFNSKRQPNEFTDAILAHKVDYVVYGHLHGMKGRISLSYEMGGTNFLLTSCDIVNNIPVLVAEI